jgi:hypothetical protein
VRKKGGNELIAAFADLLADDVCIDGMTVTLKRSFPCFDMQLVAVDQRTVDVQQDAANASENVGRHRVLRGLIKSHCELIACAVGVERIISCVNRRSTQDAQSGSWRSGLFVTRLVDRDRDPAQRVAL